MALISVASELVQALIEGAHAPLGDVVGDHAAWPSQV
jgi:hypothetical protein